MAKACGVDVGIGGNLGVPALDLLSPSRRLYVLELSSFQLESTRKLGAQVACILNLSDDHMDRYRAVPGFRSPMQAYHHAKQRIYFGAKHIVANKDDALTQPPLAEGVKCVQFGLSQPDLTDYGLLQDGAEVWLAKGITLCLTPLNCVFAAATIGPTPSRLWHWLRRRALIGTWHLRR